MRRSAASLLVAATALLASPVHAQQRSYDAAGIEVSVSFNLVVPTKGGDLQGQRESPEQGRRALYEIAAKECANLLATIASRFELRRLNVQDLGQAQVVSRRPGPASISGVSWPSHAAHARAGHQQSRTPAIAKPLPACASSNCGPKGRGARLRPRRGRRPSTKHNAR